MAGMLVLKPGADWSATGGLFDWTLGFLIARLTAPDAVDRLREVVDNNLGSLWLADLPAEARDQAVTQLRDHLVETGRRELPDSEQKADVLRHLQELADLARELS